MTRPEERQHYGITRYLLDWDMSNTNILKTHVSFIVLIINMHLKHMDLRYLSTKGHNFKNKEVKPLYLAIDISTKIKISQIINIGIMTS